MNLLLILKEVFVKVLHINVTLQCVCLFRKLNGVGRLSGRWSSAWSRSTESFTILGGVPVLSLPTFRPSLSLSVWEIPALEGASPIRPPGDVVWPTKREPDKKVPVVRTTELAEMKWPPFAELTEVNEDHEMIYEIIFTVKIKDWHYKKLHFNPVTM